MADNPTRPGVASEYYVDPDDGQKYLLTRLGAVADGISLGGGSIADFWTGSGITNAADPTTLSPGDYGVNNSGINGANVYVVSNASGTNVWLDTGKTFGEFMVPETIEITDHPGETAYFQWIFGDEGTTDVIPDGGTVTSQWYDVSTLDFNKLSVTLITTTSVNTGGDGFVVEVSRDGINDEVVIETLDFDSVDSPFALDGADFDISVYPYMRFKVTDDAAGGPGTVKGFMAARGN